MANPVSLLDMEAMAKLRMDHNTWEYVAGGATDEITLRRNREAFGEIAINPRYLEELTERDMSTTVLGQRVALPIMAAPTGAQYLAHPGRRVGRGSRCGRGRGADDGRHRRGLHGGGGRGRRLRASLAPALPPSRRRDPVHGQEGGGGRILGPLPDGRRGSERARRRGTARNAFNPPAARSWADLRERPDLLEKAKFDEESRSRRPTWEKLAWFKSITSMPLVAKGILTARDAVKCADHGVDAIVVSNHGARVVDTTLASIEALPAIVDAVGDRMEVYMDSGIRRGTDVLKALALGARAVLVGRPVMWGLAVGGDEGIRTMFEILRGELASAMNFVGVSTIGDIERDMVTLGWRSAR